MSALYRTARPEDLALFSDWAAAEGWNPGLDDMGAFYGTDPAGFFVADVGGEPVAAISVVNHSDNFAFLGFYLCLPEFRGQGIGYGLWSHALYHAGGRVVGLDGVEAQEANYARSGFIRRGATLRYSGAMEGAETTRVRPVRMADDETIYRLDRAANGVDRRPFLGSWTTDATTRRTFVLDEDRGFATLRRCREGVKFGPIIAGTSDDALLLMRAGLAHMASPEVFVDVPDANAPLIKALSDEGFVPTFQSARMYCGPSPQTTGLLQAIATMELG